MQNLWENIVKFIKFKEKNIKISYSIGREKSPKSDVSKHYVPSKRKKSPSPTSRRKKWKYGTEPRIFYRIDNPWGTGKCWHCGIILNYESRRYQDGRCAWNVDHYPVRLQDIEGQCCFGITNDRDERNLVPACILCNISHKYEKNYRIFCGRSQCLCSWWCSLKVIGFSALWLIFIAHHFSKEQNWIIEN